MNLECVIYGAGSVGKLAIQIIKDLNKINKIKYNINGIIDDDEYKKNTTYFEYHVFSIDVVKTLTGVNNVIISFSDNYLRKMAFKKLNDEFSYFKFPSIIHPQAWLGNNVLIGQGSIVYPGVYIDPDVVLGTCNVINKSVTIGHDTLIGDFVTLSPGVNIGGFNKIGQGTFIGIGASTIQFIEIGKNCTIGAGAVIIKNVPDGVTVVGNPGRVVSIQ